MHLVDLRAPGPRPIEGALPLLQQWSAQTHARLSREEEQLQREEQRTEYTSIVIDHGSTRRVLRSGPWPMRPAQPMS